MTYSGGGMKATTFICLKGELMRKYSKTTKTLFAIFIVLAIAVIFNIVYMYNVSFDNEETSVETVEPTDKPVSTTKMYVSEDGTEYKALYDQSNRLIDIEKVDKPDSLFNSQSSIPIPTKEPVPTPVQDEYTESEPISGESGGYTYQTPENTDKQVNSEFEHLIADDFKLTHYCHCAMCNGQAGQPTASGRMPEVGVTVGVDPKLIRLGSYLRIEIPDGNGGYKVYRAKARADDTGGAIKGHKIDIFVGSHQETINLGVIRNARVYLIGELE